MTINETILTIVANTSIEEAQDLVRQWRNVEEAEIDAAGDIWVANPQTGHWLDDDAKARFIAWCKAL